MRFTEWDIKAHTIICQTMGEIGVFQSKNIKAIQLFVNESKFNSDHLMSGHYTGFIDESWMEINQNSRRSNCWSTVIWSWQSQISYIWEFVAGSDNPKDELNAFPEKGIFRIILPLYTDEK